MTAANKERKEHGQRSEFNHNLGNWLAGFWSLIGGFFRRRIDVIRGEHTFTDLGCQFYTIDVNMNDCIPQKVWVSIEEPTTGEICNMVSVHRSDDNVLIMTELESVPCTVKWFIIC